MVGSRKDLPQYNAANLTDALRVIWRSNGPFKHFSDRAIKPDSDNEICLVGGNAFSNLYGVKQLLYFQDAVETPYLFCVHNTNLFEDQVERVASVLKKRANSLPERKSRLLQKIFGEPEVFFETVEFGNKGNTEEIKGILVLTPVSYLPRGKEGHLSIDLFEIAYNTIVAPCHRVQINGEPIRSDVWYDFADVSTRNSQKKRFT